LTLKEMLYDFEPYSHLFLRLNTNQQYYPFSGSLYPEKSLKNKKFFTTVLVMLIVLLYDYSKIQQ